MRFEVPAWTAMIEDPGRPEDVAPLVRHSHGRTVKTNGMRNPPASGKRRTMRTEFQQETITADVCVVGGGMAGLCAAISAARNGAKTVLCQDRPVLGGNASSEVRMWICGARRNSEDPEKIENTEAGILEEIRLRNLYYNPELNYPQWDLVLYGIAREQENLTLILNCSVNQVRTRGNRIRSVRGWQTSSQKWITIEAVLFVDCSGDSVLRVSGAETRRGREARTEFGESLAPAHADSRTMGNSILIQCREVTEHHPFRPPPWARVYTDETVPKRELMPAGNNFWWLEVGGAQDTIGDAEAIRDELLRIAYGIWAYIKNHPDGRGHGWDLEWIGAVPGKRESIRYVGDHVLTQNDIEAGGPFEDRIAYGGWTMDDHHPDGVRHPGAPTIFHPAPSPYGIPYRCLYSKNIDNLFFAGRNISVTHMALSSTRVIGTCSLLGQAAGTAAALAIARGASPRELGTKHLRALQQRLMDQDMYLPGKRREIPECCRKARMEYQGRGGEMVLDGIDRNRSDGDHAWHARVGQSLALLFDGVYGLTSCRIVFDSDFSRHKRMPCSWPLAGNRVSMPGTLVRDFTLEILDPAGHWKTAKTVHDQIGRLVRIALSAEARGVRLGIQKTWGNEIVRVFAFQAEGVPVPQKSMPPVGR